jgi:protein involved in polysaccharide export with SLBB domain
MSVEALETGAATARQLAMDVFDPSHSALEIEERLNALANALEDAGGARTTSRKRTCTLTRLH